MMCYIQSILRDIRKFLSVGWSIANGAKVVGASVGTRDGKVGVTGLFDDGALSSSSLEKVIGHVGIYYSGPLGSCPYPWLSFMVSLVVTYCSSSYNDDRGLSIFMGSGTGGAVSSRRCVRKGGTSIADVGNNFLKRSLMAMSLLLDI
ncbi:hypothetical protein V6N11_084249 [Hibiscus sabdariffa]|uniref:Uncharacterized protein n=1 Tax=Hibiscus sabdariffa TaxID=183260 RepID=A0ABR2QSG6_9ROSI